MFGTVALDVLIGLVTIFLLFSLVGSAVVEFLAGALGWRAANLRAAINNMLSLRQVDNRDANLFFSHPLIDALSEDYRPKWVKSVSAFGHAIPLLERFVPYAGIPSYIPNPLFADVLIDLVFVRKAQVASPTHPAFWTIRQALLDAFKSSKKASEDSQGNANAPADDNSSKSTETPPQAGQKSTGMMGMLKGSLQTVFGPDISKSSNDPIDLASNLEILQNLNLFALKAIAAIPDATPDVDNRRFAFFHQQIEDWYAATTDRASGWYKRRVQKLLFVIGLVVAVALNVDTLSMTHYLFNSPEARASAVEAANQLVNTPPKTNASTQPTSAPAVAASVTPPADDAMPTLPDKKIAPETLKNLGIPLGWSRPELLYPSNFSEWTPYNWLMKSLGLLITAFALCLGAPFWFDALNKLVNLRTSRPPEPAPEKNPAKDPEALGPLTSGPNVPPPSSAALPPPALPPDYWSQPQRLLDFEKAALDKDQYSSGKAAMMARASLLAYSSFPTIKQTVAPWLNISVEQIDARFKTFDNRGTQAFLARTTVGTTPVAILSFRGTEPKELNDLIADAKISLKVCTAPTPGKMHCGFVDAFEAVLSDLPADKNLKSALNALPEKTRLYITGHSLGAALATVCASYCFANNIAPGFQLYTFGSPRVGDPNFCGDMNSRLKVPKDPSGKAPVIPADPEDKSYMLAHAFRFINEEDVVTRVAPRTMGYDHVGITLYLDANGRVDLNFAEWLRFLNTVINAADDFRTECGDFIKHHSMELYVRKLDNLAAG